MYESHSKWFRARRALGKVTRRRHFQQRQRRLHYESLEDRNLLAVFTVTNTFDAGADSLRWAIDQANTNPGADAIHFNIDGGGSQTISLSSALPTITDTVELDATTQPGYAGAPLIEIDGGNNPLAGLVLADHLGSVVRGLVINRCQAEGIWLIRGGSHVIEGNYLGTNASGMASSANLGGIWIAGSSNNRIGSDGDGINDSQESNLISGNTDIGIALQFFDIDAVGNVISGNRIGVDVSGTTAVGNRIGIQDGGVNTLIGMDGTGDSIAKRNLISGNREHGVLAFAGTTIAGNFIGVDETGQFLLPKGSNGGQIPSIHLQGNNAIVGTNGDGVGDAFEGNVIAGNLIGGGAIVVGAHGGGSNNVVAGNLIGLNADGTASLGQQAVGIGLVNFSNGGTGNLIGTNGDGVSDQFERNVIATTNANAIRLGPTGTIRISGNYIGTDKTGMTPLGGGVFIADGASGNLLGTNGDGVGDAVESNVLAAGVEIMHSATTNNVFAGNYIGVAADGVASFGGGVNISQGASLNRIGTNGDGIGDADERNVIGYVRIADAGTSGNVVAGNYVGIAADGITSLNATGDGGLVAIRSANGNRIGTDADGVNDAIEGNVISGGLGDGVLLAFANDNFLAGNRIGASADGATAVPNAGAGVINFFGTGNTIGGAAPDAGNLIAFNNGIGVAIAGASATGNSIGGNSIHSNGGLGIDLEDAIVTPNDPGDADTGANDFQNFPELATAASTGASVSISGNLNSTSTSTFRIEFFANAALDPTGYGEGETYLGFADVTTDAAGDANFSITLASTVPVGHFITATATNAAGSTSEFSLGIVVVSGNEAPVAAVAGPATGVPFRPQTFIVSATDDAADEASGFIFEINWGDGETTTIPAMPGNGAGVAVDHTYTGTGSFVIEVVAIDSHGSASDPATTSITVSTAAVIGDDLVVGGTSANDIIHFARVSNSSVKVFVNGQWLGPFAVADRVIAYGGPGNDILSVGVLVNRDAWLYGGDGNDLLNGGPGNDVLQGGDGVDLATGGFGRDLIVGGQGADLLFGNFDEDIIIAGATAYDNDQTALGLIMAEWTSSRTFQQRVANLEGAGSGTAWTNRMNANIFLVSQPGGPHDVTVFDDESADLLVGGADRDWFFANYTGPGVRDLIADLTWRDLAEDLVLVESLDQ
jgi:hypothetical protein